MIDFPPFNPKTVDPHDALCHAIGEYIKNFSSAEHGLSTMGAVILKVDIRTIQFLWRDLGIKPKIQILRRASLETFGPKTPNCKAFHKLLNDLEACSKFRNDLVHGIFVAGAGHGKMGNSLGTLWQGMAPLTDTQVRKQTHQVLSVSFALGEFMSRTFATTRAKKPSTSERGDQ